jgi:hypothetical protein
MLLPARVERDGSRCARRRRNPERQNLGRQNQLTVAVELFEAGPVGAEISV